MLLGWLGMTGLILMLHFGTFHLLSCAWRAAGVDARPLMLHPSGSESVSEFWGRRWNTAFRDLTHRFLFRPLSGRLGPRRAILAGFLASGLVHDLVISLPAGGGYGWPTLYFVIQGAALVLERSRAGRAMGLGSGIRGRLFALLTAALPAWGLFHPPFVRNVVVPFMRAAGVA
jgi:D-alanyl-lipoteichoic acid acyltransferase DltB (MBOAT superfamily)